MNRSYMRVITFTLADSSTRSRDGGGAWGPRRDSRLVLQDRESRKESVVKGMLTIELSAAASSRCRRWISICWFGKIMQGGDNPSPQVQRSHDAAPRCTYTADFYAALRPPHPPQRLICDSLHAFKGLHGSPGYLTNKDLRWEFEEVQELVLEERKQLLQGSALMGPDSLLAAYTYEQLPLPSQCMHPAAAAAAAAAAPTAAAAAETAGDCSRSGSTSPCPSSPAAWSTASTRSSRPNGDACSQSKDRASAHATTNTNNNSNSSSSSRDSASLETFPGCVQTSALMLDQRRAELLSRKESITAEEVFAAVRTITDPEHPYTLEQLMVVAPEYVKTRCSSCSRECTAAAADSNSSCQCDQQQQQQQQQQHWGRGSLGVSVSRGRWRR
ncbi:hypothetical protein Esti_004350 [Eimeria stiedai]